MKNSRLLPSVLVIAAAVSLPAALPRFASAQNVVTNYEKIAEGGNGAAGFLYREVSLASISQTGRVAFGGQDLSRFIGVYTSPGGVGAAFTTIATPASVTGAQPSALSLNNAGTVTFSYGDVNTGVRKVVAGNGGAVTYVNDPATAPTLPNFTSTNLLAFPTINNAGAIAYGASSFNSGNGQSTYYIGVAQNGVFTPAVQSTNPGNLNGIAFNNFADGHLNNAGQIAFNFTSTSNKGYVLRRNTDGTLTSIAAQIQPQTTIGFNDNGFVTYVGVNNTSLFLSNGITTTTIGTALTLDPVTGLTLGGYSSFAGGSADFLSVNNLNQVAFRSAGGGAPVGIYVGDGSRIITVAQVGNALFGSTITALDLSNQAINDAGQVVFTAHLADGRSEIVRGTLPGVAAVGAPEPASWAFLLPGFVIGAGVLRRQQHRTAKQYPAGRSFGGVG